MNELFDMIEPRWHAALERMIEEGAASAEFLEYLENAPGRDDILDAALALQTERIHGFSEAIRNLSEPRNDLDSRDEFVTSTAAQFRAALEATAAAGVRQQMRIFESAFRDVHPDDVELLALTLNGYRQMKRRKSA